MAEECSFIPQNQRMLTAVRALHTAVWAFMVLCIAALPVLGALHRWRLATWAAGIVFAECAVLLANGWKCPMTNWAERYTDRREANFDIYLPEPLARHNKTIFSVLFGINLAIVAMEWFWGRR